MPPPRLDGSDGVAILHRAIQHEFAGRIAVTSSFGAESAVLLAMVAEVDPYVPVLFLDTGQHFPETLAYRAELTERLGLRDVRDIRPATDTTSHADPEGVLWQFDADACCRLRKVVPLQSAIAPFAAWVTGRKRGQSRLRQNLLFREQEGAQVKINPLADWTAEQVEAERLRRDLPAHPLVRHGYFSIGCGPCTRPVAGGQDRRAGRWAGSAKTECGIHRLNAAS